MSSQKQAFGEFAGSLFLILISGLLPLLKVEGLNFATALCIAYGFLLMVMRDAHVKTLNPALTLIDIFRKQIETGEGLIIILSQLAGSALGAFFLSILADYTLLPTPAAASCPAGLLLIIQLIFGSALTFAYIRGKEESKYEGPWLAALMYGCFSIGGEATAFLNPAAAFGAYVCRGISGVHTDESSLAALLFAPLLASGLTFLLDKSSEHHIQMSELIGTFFLTFGLLAAAAHTDSSSSISSSISSSSSSAAAAAIGFAFYAAAVTRMVAPVSGGSLNPALTGGAALSERRSISKDLLTVWVFQLCGATAAAMLLSRIAAAAAPAASTAAAAAAATTTTSNNMEGLLLAAGLSSLLMISNCLYLGDFFGSPAAALIGTVYGLSLLGAAAPLPINPAVSLAAAAAAAIFNSPHASTLFQTIAEVSVPFVGCIGGAAILQLIPSEYKRSV